MKLKKYLLATALVGLGSAPTIAADLAARPYTKAPALAAVYDWTGFYIGVNAGVGLGRDRLQHDWLNTGSPYSIYTSPQGGFGGAQIGYNWQTGSVLGPIVFGVEADIQGAGLSDDRTNLSLAGITDNLWPEARLVRHRARAHRHRQWSGAELCDRRLRVRKRQDQRDRVGDRHQLRPSRPIVRRADGWSAAASKPRWAATGPERSSTSTSISATRRTSPTLLVATPINTEIRENIFRVGLNYRIGGNSAYAPVAAANWAGFYLGGNFGSGTGRDRSSLSVPAAAILETFNLAPDGINGGVQAGYNWQAANWVFGLEADIQGSTQKDNKTCILGCTPGLMAAYDATLPWFGTVRGRLGYSVGSTLFYATGGLAYGSIKTKINTTSFVGPVTQSFSHTNTGWTAGAGIETPFTLLGLLGPNWTTKAEYLYVDLGSTSDNFIIAATPATATRSVTEHVFRTGINYHFNSPVVAKY